ncbi:MAG: UDP-N-acetylglucosamine--N-acetylmuramyl-(pentapeptide) pyrophosphoryl-undecaprenol [Solirubrobacteraceae bacterium]|nr:UDP-N-acetylglucosamine--N-acetylmuramyl-(pentapeptide) pyrophosphoryl-undecaprenol [Solirubrobacteraceae bacterium]
MTGGRVDVCLASSSGGHLELLLALRGAYEHRSHAFVTLPGRQADDLRATGAAVVTVTNPWRSPLKLARNLAQAAAAAWRLRPRTVVCTGAGATVPFALVARALGARLVFVETMARVHGGSLSGRILYRFAHHFLVQWPELLAAYPRAEVCRPALLEALGTANGGTGTFIATGTHGQPFDRLLRLADEAAQAGLLPEPIVAQGGPATYRPRAFDVVPSLQPEEVRRAIGSSAVVVSHGGSGLVSLALRCGRRPLVLPRLREHGEHLDDHQVETTAKLADLGLVVALDRTPLADAVRLGLRPPAGAVAPGPRLVDRLRELV